MPNRIATAGRLAIVVAALGLSASLIGTAAGVLPPAAPGRAAMGPMPAPSQPMQPALKPPARSNWT